MMVFLDLLYVCVPWSFGGLLVHTHTHTPAADSCIFLANFVISLSAQSSHIGAVLVNRCTWNCFMLRGRLKWKAFFGSIYDGAASPHIFTTFDQGNVQPAPGREIVKTAAKDNGPITMGSNRNEEQHQLSTEIATETTTTTTKMEKSISQHHQHNNIIIQQFTWLLLQF